MADLEKTVRIVFSGKDDLSKSAKNIGMSLDMVEDGVSKITRPMAELADDILKIEAALGILAAGGLAFAIAKSGDFQTRWGEIRTLLNDTGPDVEVFRDQILGYAASSVSSLDQITGAVYQTISKYTDDYNEILSIIATADQLGVAGVSNVESALNVLVSVLSAYNESVDQASKYSDILFGIVKEGGTTLPELEQPLARVTALAGPLNVAFEEIGSAIAVLTARGMPTEEALTAIRGILSSILSPTTEAAKAADALGVAFGADALKDKGLVEFLSDIWEQAEGSAKVVGDLFGNVRALSGVLALFGPDDGAALIGTLGKLESRAAPVAEAYAKMVDTFENKNSAFKSSVEVALVKAGDKVLDIYGDIIDGSVGVVDGISRAIGSGALDPLFDIVRDSGGDLADWLKDLAEVLPSALEKVDWTEFSNTYGDLINKIQGLFNALFPQDLSTEEGVVGALQSIVNLGSLINEAAGGILNAIEPIVAVLGGVIKYFNDSPEAAGDWAAGIGEALGNAKVHEVIKNEFGFWGALAAQTFGTAYATFQEREAKGQNKYFGWVQEAGENFSNWWSGFWGDGKGKKDLEKLPEAVIDTVDVVDDATDKIGDNYDRLDGLDAKLKLDGSELPKWGDAAKETLDEVEEKAVETKKKINLAFDEETNTYVVVSPDYTTIQSTKKAIDDSVPDEKVMRIQADIDIAKIKAASDVVQSMIEWEAKLGIAEVEANAQKVESIMDSIGRSASGAADVLSTLFGSAAELSDSGFWKYDIERWIDAQIEIQQGALQVQTDMATAEIELMQARKEALDRGEGMITVDGAGLQPHLEAFMFEILSAIQIRANQEGANFLVGA